MPPKPQRRWGNNQAGVSPAFWQLDSADGLKGMNGRTQGPAPRASNNRLFRAAGAADTIQIISNGDLKGGFINSLAETMMGMENVSINTRIKTVISARRFPCLMNAA